MLRPWDSASPIAVRNIVIEDTEMLRNRRHGASIDRANGVRFVRCRMDANGTNLVDGLDVNDGNSGDMAFGEYYGNGVDVEEYLPEHGSMNIWFIDCQAINNAREGILILRRGDATLDTSFGRYFIDGGRYNKGIHSISGASIQITPISASPDGAVFGMIYVLGAFLGDGSFTLRGGSALVQGVTSSASTVVLALEHSLITTDALKTYAAPSGVISHMVASLGRYTLGSDAFEPPTDGDVSIGTSSRRFKEIYSNDIRVGPSGVTPPVWTSGMGSPEGVVSGRAGSLYVDLSGGPGAVLYVKESGFNTNTGWVAK